MTAFQLKNEMKSVTKELEVNSNEGINTKLDVLTKEFESRGIDISSPSQSLLYSTGILSVIGLFLFTFGLLPSYYGHRIYFSAITIGALLFFQDRFKASQNE